MPVVTGRDLIGSYYKWGKTGKHYYYTPGDPVSRQKARRKARIQGIAIKLRMSKYY